MYYKRYKRGKLQYSYLDLEGVSHKAQIIDVNLYKHDDEVVVHMEGDIYAVKFNKQDKIWEFLVN